MFGYRKLEKRVKELEDLLRYQYQIRESDKANGLKNYITDKINEKPETMLAANTPESYPHLYLGYSIIDYYKEYRITLKKAVQLILEHLNLEIIHTPGALPRMELQKKQIKPKEQKK